MDSRRKITWRIGTSFRLHQHAEDFLEARYPMARVLTAWPASDELTRPFLGYVTRPMQVVRIENFALEEVMGAADARDQFEVALVFFQPNMSPTIRCWRIHVCGRSGRPASSDTIAMCPQLPRLKSWVEPWSTPKAAMDNG